MLDEGKAIYQGQCKMETPGVHVHPDERTATSPRRTLDHERRWKCGSPRDRDMDIPPNFAPQ